MILYGYPVSDSIGTLSSSIDVLGMFVISGILAIVANVFTVKMVAKVRNNQ